MQKKEDYRTNILRSELPFFRMIIFHKKKILSFGHHSGQRTDSGSSLLFENLFALVANCFPLLIPPLRLTIYLRIYEKKEIGQKNSGLLMSKRLKIKKFPLQRNRKLSLVKVTS